ncbi:MAG: histidine phosphatase family protein [Gammaproteobacteria bacterium]|nr:histidine phosphatase family protein [Gammaproteobacteria bacterium]
MSLRTKEPSTQVYFVRHGKTDYPDNRIYCDDREDPQLSEEGYQQARAMAEYFASLGACRLLVSPAARTWATAEAIARVTSLSREPSPWLTERRYGAWEGLYFDDIQRQYPDEYRAWKSAPVGYTPPGGEGMDALNARLQGGLQGLITQHRGEILVLVTHVGPIRALVAQAFDLPPEQSRQLRVDYASITKVDYGVQRNNLIFLNHVSYKKL